MFESADNMWQHGNFNRFIKRHELDYVSVSVDVHGGIVFFSFSFSSISICYFIDSYIWVGLNLLYDRKRSTISTSGPLLPVDWFTATSSQYKWTVLFNCFGCCYGFCCCCCAVVNIVFRLPFREVDSFASPENNIGMFNYSFIFPHCN